VATEQSGPESSELHSLVGGARKGLRTSNQRSVHCDILSNMVIASFADGRNLVGEGKTFINDEAKVASRVYRWC